MVIEMSYFDPTNNFMQQFSGMNQPFQLNQPQQAPLALASDPVQNPVQGMTTGGQLPAAGMGQFNPAQWAAFQSAMPRNWMGGTMGMTQGSAQSLWDSGQMQGAFPDQAAFQAWQQGLPVEHGFMDKMGGMQGLMGIGQLGMTGANIYNAFKQMQLQKDMFNEQKNMMRENVAMQKKTINNKYRDQENNRGLFMGKRYDADAAYEKKKL
jgi:hypothetical protein